jgi:thiol-disulfide isomerase/thioredoxin
LIVSAYRLLLAVALPVAVTASMDSSAEDQGAMQKVAPAAVHLTLEGEFPSLDGALGWINSPPLAPADLRGKVVLVDFWTYTCINWRRTLPYLRAWDKRYRQLGLVVIGVHTPEFPFEANADNIRWAVKDMRIDYPVAIDSRYGVWRAFSNQYWPALYLIDANGQIRHHSFGEGDYDRVEKIIQQLLSPTGFASIDATPAPIEASGAEVAADWRDLRSPETYLGTGQAENFASPGGAIVDEPHAYTAPKHLNVNQWALVGDWTVRKGFAAPDAAGGRIVFRFHARDLHLVMGPRTSGSSVRFRVLIDGQAPAAAHGTDIDEQGSGTITEQRLYQLIRQREPVADREFEIEFLDPGAEAFVFTFG